ncbi:MAG: substrate-binding domain-containing protein [Dysgonamonadaceae bacterium]|nr:substrate-binding domain-containing protein [Dysgonamonadaceae bacterium]
MFKILLIALAGILTLVSCKKKEKSEPSDTLRSGIIDIACDEGFANLIDAEVEAFNAHFPAAFVFPRYTSENQAIDLLVKDSVRVAVATRDLYGDERSKLGYNRVVRKNLFAFEGVAVIANKSNTDSLLSVSTLKKILTGEITEWKQINPASPLGTIRTIFVNKESSVLRYLIDSVTGGTNLSPNLYSQATTGELFDKITELPNAIGIIGFNQLGSQRSSLFEEITSKTRFIWISKEEKAVPSNSYLPFQGELNEGKYPLWRPVYTLLSETRDGLGKGFCFFLTQQVGQKIILKEGLMPITDAQNMFIAVE